MFFQDPALKKVVSFLNRLEEVLLCSLLTIMVLLGTLLILFRNVISISLFWIDPILRHLVLWVALLGASVATREDRHIAIDLLSRYLSPQKRFWVQGGLHLFSAGVCFLLIWPAVRFIQDEYLTGKPLALGIPIWVAQSIIPVMLTVLGCRFLSKTWAGFKNGKTCFTPDSEL
jgi:TRAP-type C4-dicarboxylate transport system permease small subunit